MLNLVWHFDLFTLSAALRINCQQLRGGRHWRGQDGDDDGDGEGGRFGLLCWSSQITMECRNHSPRWPWCQPSWWGSSVFIMSPLRKSWIVCVMAMMVFWAKGFWSQTAGMSELPSKSFSTSSPLPHCLHNKPAILSFKKRPTKSTNKRSHKKFSKLRRRGALSLRVLRNFGVIKSSRNPGKATLAQCAQNS